MNIEYYKELKNSPQSYWLASTHATDYPELSEDIRVDVAIVGGGMAGILCAYLLQQDNIDIAVIDAGKIMNGTTSHTTAKITSQHSLIYDKIKNKMGFELAKQYADANEHAILQIKDIIDKHQIDCDYTPQSAFAYTQDDKNVEKIENEVKAASELGIKASFIEEIPFPISIKAGVMFDNQAQFHPRKFLLPLVDVITEAGVKIYENSRIVELNENDGITLYTEQGKKITANKVVIATRYPFYNKQSMYYSRIYAERSYIIAISAKEKYPGGMYINIEEPTRSLRGCDSKEGQLILIGGENHKTGQGTDMSKHYCNLVDYAASLFTIEDIKYRWSSQDCMTVDSIPYVGYYNSDTSNILIATGFQKWGMTNSMASAQILRDLIVEGSSPCQDVYNPSRKNVLGASKTFIKENFDVAKHLISGKIASIPKNVKIQPGEGKVLEHDGERTGAYRDENGNLFLVNTTCTHLGCELNWNCAEKSWDCPCHGSRFSYTGSIIDGPSVDPLVADKNVNIFERVIKEDF
ncbi:MAG: FAD-dependent oxidoreductase [Clostridiaceae bacterium]|jgi:glycine/D-amino acid oxidase-like deaminating enzyme/nitrite reductase/ring-hydroxylating ferredoxin subunit|nr:FAD-dependent oxidoreductase [Clostridiaceae bacterium]